MVKDEEGKVYGRLTVLSRAPNKTGKAAWRCLCICGSQLTVSGDSLRQGKTRSCGCLRVDGPKLRPTFHGHSNAGGRTVTSPTYHSWREMWGRCTKEGHPSFQHYGARGITVCARWKDFRSFLADMGERPQGKYLDRIRNSLGYSPRNCRWSTRLEQNRNRSQVHQVKYAGREQCLAAWCSELDIPYARTYRRLIVKGWSVVDSFGLPHQRQSV